MTAFVDVVVPAQAEVGEGPVFDPRTGRLCWVDIVAGNLFETDPGTGRSRRHPIGTLLGAVAPRADRPGFAAAVADGFGLVIEGQLKIVDAVLPDPTLRMNDAKCDPAGRLWAGSCALDFTGNRGALHRWDGHEPSSVVRRGFALPNGLGWNPDATQMYLVDSIMGTVLAAEFDVASGEVGSFRTLIQIEEGLPDGLAVDVEGFLWVAIWGSSRIVRIDPDGRIAESVNVPVSQPTSCAFGPDGRLYVTSARSGLDVASLARQPLAGSVLAIDTATSGVPVAGFAG